MGMPIMANLLALVNSGICCSMKLLEPMDESDRIDSWKQIAAHLGKSERTVRRWQSVEGLPVHRHVHQERGSVWAYKSEIDQWLASRKEGPTPLAEEPDPLPAPRRSPYWLALALPLIGAAYWFTRTPAPPPILIPEEEVLTALPGAAYAPSISPDTRKVVFFWSGHQSGSGLYLKEIGSEALTPLVTVKKGSAGFVYSPVWSPDGKTIAYLRRTWPEKSAFAMFANSSETWLCLIDASGGEERRLIRLAKDNLFYANSAHLSWTADGKRILAPMADGEKRGVFWIPIGAGSPVLITKASDVNYFAPSLSPTGDAFLYMSQKGPPQAAIESLFRQALNPDGTPEGAPKLLYEARTMTSGLAWLPSGKEILLCRADSALVGGFNNRLYRLRMDATSELIPLGLGNCSTVAIQSPAPGGPVFMAYASGTNTKAGIWRAPVEKIGQGERIVPSSRFDGMPTFSPDSSMIAFISNRSGGPELWVASREGLNPRKLTEGSHIAGVPSWSPDGTLLLYGASMPPDSTGKSDSAQRVFTIAVAGGKPLPVQLGAIHAVDPFWAASGNEFFFWVQGQLWRANLKGSPPQMVREFPSHWFRASGSHISNDRHILYARAANPFALYRADLETGKESLIADGLIAPAFATSKRNIYFLSKQDSSICSVPQEGGPVRKLGVIPSQNLQFLLGLDVTQDDSTIIWSLTEEQKLDLMVVRNLK